MKVLGIESLVFIDESGFEEFASALYGWSKRGEIVYGEKQGKRGKKENLIAARRKKSQDLIAPMLFTGGLNTTGFAGWLKIHLLSALTTKSLLIMDNAPIHRKNEIKQLVEISRE